MRRRAPTVLCVQSAIDRPAPDDEHGEPAATGAIQPAHATGRRTTDAEWAFAVSARRATRAIQAFAVRDLDGLVDDMVAG